MNTLFWLTFIIVLATETRAQTPSRTDEQVLKAISERMKIEIKSTKYFRSASPEAAWTGFRYLTANAQYGNLDLTKQAGRAIAENAAVEKYVSEGMAKLPHDFYNDDERTRFLVPLGDVPAPWSLRLLGRYLIDKTPMTYPESPPDYGSSRNSSLAIGALSRMGFSDAPTKNRNPNITPAAEKAWRDWWKANEGRVEQRIYEINPGYVPPQVQQPVSATPIPTPISTPQVASVTPPRSTPKPIATPVVVNTTPTLTAQTNRSNLLAYVIGVVIALGILFAVVKVFRK